MPFSSREFDTRAMDVYDGAFVHTDPDPFTDGKSIEFRPGDQILDMLTSPECKGQRHAAGHERHQHQHELGEEGDIHTHVLQAHDQRHDEDRAMG